MYQDRTLKDHLVELLAQPRETIGSSRQGQESVLKLPLPDRHRPLVDGSPDSMVNFAGWGVQRDVRAAAGDRLLLKIGGPDCSPQLDDSTSRSVTPSVTAYGNRSITRSRWRPQPIVRSQTLVLVPAYYRYSQYLSEIEMPSGHAAWSGPKRVQSGLPGRRNLLVIRPSRSRARLRQT